MQTYRSNGSTDKIGTYDSGTKKLTVKEYGTVSYRINGGTERHKWVPTKEITYTISETAGSLTASKSEKTLRYSETGARTPNLDTITTSSSLNNAEVAELLEPYLQKEEDAS